MTQKNLKVKLKKKLQVRVDTEDLIIQDLVDLLEELIFGCAIFYKNIFNYLYLMNNIYQINTLHFLFLLTYLLDCYQTNKNI